jgi:hypothetical protein
MSGVLSAILGAGGRALGSATGDALAGEAGAGLGATIGQAAGHDIAAKISERRQKKKACQQAFPDNPDMCDNSMAFR